MLTASISMQVAGDDQEETQPVTGLQWDVFAPAATFRTKCFE